MKVILITVKKKKKKKKKTVRVRYKGGGLRIVGRGIPLGDPH